jgi:hypothetical protein
LVFDPAAHDVVASDGPLAALQIRQGTGRAARHPIQILAEAYGLSLSLSAEAESGRLNA